MNRAQTSLNLPYDPSIQPAAQPVDKFHAPLVNAPDLQGAKDLQALAEGLGKLDDTVTQVFNQRFQAYTENSKLQATADRAEQRLDSMAKFRAAVNSGKITQTQNPWYLAQMQEEIGRVVANKVSAQAWMEYEQNPDVRKSNDPAVVDKFFSDKFGQAIQTESDGSVWAAGAMSKVLDQSRNELVQRHVAVRARELPEEREVAAKADVADVLSQYDGKVRAAAQAGDPEALKIQVGAKTALQGKLNDLLHTVDPITANKWVKEAVMDHALSVEDADVAKDLIGSLTTKDGKGLIMNDQDRATLTHLYDRVSDMKLHRIQLQDTLDEKAEKDQVKSVAGYMLKEYSDAKAKGIEFDFNNALTPAQIASLPMGVQRNLLQFMSQISAFNQQGQAIKDENARRAILKSSAGDFVLGRMTPDKQVTFTDLMLQAGGHHDLATLVQTKRQLEDMKYPDESDPTAVADLVKRIGVGDLSGTRAVDAILDLSTSGKLSARDSREFSMFMLNRIYKGDQWQDRGEFNVSAARLLTLIRDKRRDNVLSSGNATQERLDTVMQEGTSQAAKDFLFSYNDLTSSDDWAKLKDPKQRMARINDLIDQVSHSNGGYTEVEAQQAATNRQAQEEKAAADEAKRLAERKGGKTPPPADPLLDQYMKVDPSLKSLDPTIQESLKSIGLTPEQVLPDPKLGKRILGGGGAAADVWAARNRSGDPLARLLFLRSYANASSGLTASPLGGSVAEPPPSESDVFSAWQGSLLQADALQGRIISDDIPGRLRYTIEQIHNQGGLATPTQKNIVSYLWSKLREYTLLRQYAGYSVPEIQKLPTGSHLLYPMFASESDIDKRGPDVGKSLGLTPDETVTFMSRQKRLLYLRANDE